MPSPPLVEGETTGITRIERSEERGTDAVEESHRRNDVEAVARQSVSNSPFSRPCFPRRR